MRGRHNHRRRLHGDSELMLAAMVDMMVNVLIFLLAMYGTGGTHPPAGMDLARSTSTNADHATVIVVVSATNIVIDGKTLVAGKSYDEIVTEAQKAPLAAAFTQIYADHQAKDKDHEPELEIQSARDAPWDAVRAVLVGAGEAGFVKLRFSARPAHAEP